MKLATSLLLSSSLTNLKIGEALAASPLKKNSAEIKSKIRAPRAESYRDLIAKAEQLTLQHDRVQVSRILSGGLAQEAKGSFAYREIQKKLNELTSVFYSEQGQALFTLGETMAELRPKEAIEKFTEAQKFEQGNTTIARSMILIELKLDECDRAEASLEQLRESNELLAEIKVLAGQVMICKKEFGEISKLLTSQGGIPDETSRAAKSIVARAMWMNADMKGLKSLLTSSDQGNWSAEYYFWKWMYQTTIDVSDIMLGQKYVQECDNMSARRRKELELDISLCSAKKRVQDFLKNPSREAAIKPGKWYE